jgi:hypothetical protein
LVVPGYTLVVLVGLASLVTTFVGTEVLSDKLSRLSAALHFEPQTRPSAAPSEPDVDTSKHSSEVEGLRQQLAVARAQIQALEAAALTERSSPLITGARPSDISRSAPPKTELERLMIRGGGVPELRPEPSLGVENARAEAEERAPASLQPSRDIDANLANPLRPAPHTDLVPKSVEDPVTARARTLLEQGNTRGARILLERATQKGNAHAYYVLAQTYDSRALKQWPAAEAIAEPATAKALYTRALARGIAEAAAALAALDGS